MKSLELLKDKAAEFESREWEKSHLQVAAWIALVEAIEALSASMDEKESTAHHEAANALGQLMEVRKEIDAICGDFVDCDTKLTDLSTQVGQLHSRMTRKESAYKKLAEELSVLTNKLDGGLTNLTHRMEGRDQDQRDTVETVNGLQDKLKGVDLSIREIKECLAFTYEKVTKLEALDGSE